MWSLENPAVKNGILAGIGAAVYVLLLYLINARMVFGPASFITTVIFIVLMVRSVKAEKEVLDLLVKNNIQSAIFHWYSGGLNLIDEIVKKGYYFSINPAMVKSVS